MMRRIMMPVGADGRLNLEVRMNLMLMRTILGAAILWPVPKGVHGFWLTPLCPSMRPSPKPSGQVTVVVP